MPRDLFQEYGIKYTPPAQNEATAYQSIPSKIADYEKAGALSLAENIGRAGASALNVPSDIYEHYQGKPLYHVPSPDFSAYYPDSQAGQMGKTAGVYGEKIAEAYLPFMKAMRLAGNPITKWLATGAASGLTSALTSEGDRIDEGLKSGLEGGALGLGLGTLGAAGSGLKKFVTGLQPKEAANIIQKSHDLSLREAVSPLNTAARQAIERDVPATKLPKQMLNAARKAFPKTEDYRILLKNAKQGDHQAIRDLQSSLGAQERAILSNKNSDVAELNYAKELGQLRKDINNKQYQNYEGSGNKDLADLVRTGMNKYSEHMEKYYGHPTISRLVGEERRVPKNLVTGALREDSTFMNKFREAHPELQRTLDKEDLRQKIMSGLKYGGIGGGGIFGLYEAMHR